MSAFAGQSFIIERMSPVFYKDFGSGFAFRLKGIPFNWTAYHLADTIPSNMLSTPSLPNI